MPEMSLKEFINKVEHGIQKGLMQVVLLSKSESIPYTPVVTGNLKRSESAHFDSPYPNFSASLMASATYAVYVHSRVPFFWSGIDKVKPHIPMIIIKAIKKELKS